MTASETVEMAIHWKCALRYSIALFGSLVIIELRKLAEKTIYRTHRMFTHIIRKFLHVLLNIIIQLQSLINDYVYTTIWLAILINN